MQVVIKPFKHNGRVMMPGDHLDLPPDEYARLRVMGLVGGGRETASVRPQETAAKPPPEPKHVGGGWYELADGKKVRKKQLGGG